ncbi:signal peptide peptidase SppA [Aromatoleum petrolei]|uniref:Signal peptide peptidase SppA n=1 Tax=Aromatoleum petrolei TaxID=76116 RepID=A0ABX1MPP9_9RHOO|nr:signal peptide peptidase SppA [Aromatoleum petrolei]NMF89181.1 signal peptide peptidase SppA [Aromatoleum petrolei]QTQ36501.1 Protease IV [Aromatoleum petrolei]
MFGFLGRLFAWIWRALDLLRRVVVTLAFLLAFALVIAFALHPGPSVPDGAALVLRPAGTLVERVRVDDPLGIIRSGGAPVAQTSLPDLLEAVRAAREDDRIKALVIETDQLGQGGLSKLAELREAVIAFKSGGKPVYARGERFTQGQYFLASIADEVHLAPDGFLLLPGLARNVSYFKGALDALGVKVHVFRVGEYKSFSEPFTRTDMSDEDRQSSRELLDTLWAGMRERVAGSRKLAPEALDRYVEDYAGLLQATGGDAARAAREAGLVDALSQRDEWHQLLKARVGESADGKDYRRIDADDYLAAVRAARSHEDARVAVLVAQGSIVDGAADEDSVGGDSLAAQIRAAREDERVKAVVLRIDSPGGSAWASEVIRRELELTRREGKPVVASMSSVAASGGYWVAAGADEIWARPETLTGSIGVFAMFPELTEPLARLGVTTDRVATGPLAGTLDPRRPLEPALAQAMQLGVEHSYRRFLEIVATARRKDIAEIDAVARGRVWTGEAALRLGLVDTLGGIEDAVVAAAKRAQLERYETVWPTGEINLRHLLLRRLMSVLGPVGITSEAPLGRLLGGLQAQVADLLRWNDPQHLYGHCLCDAP